MNDPLEGYPKQDPSAFTSLFTTFFPKIHAMLVRQGVDSATAEEIAQDTMLAVWRKTHQFSEDRGTISAWIYAIARNLRIDMFRKHASRQRSYSEFEAVERLRENVTSDQDWSGSVRDIETALNALPADQLAVIQLAFVDGLSHTEIAAKLRLPPGTVKSRLRLAFKKLRATADGDT
jgi:RNA polymerase sigma-70 factor (ECF subfamily)